MTFYDTGCKGCGYLGVESAFLPPFPHVVEGAARAAMNLAIAGGVWWWFTTRKKVSTAVALHTART
jgi:hypothetical protein